MGSRTYLFLLGDVCYFVYFLCIWNLTYKITVETGEYYFEANILSKRNLEKPIFDQWECYQKWL